MSAQTFNFYLKSADCIFFKQNIYCFGFNPNIGITEFVIYKLSSEFKKIDSLKVLLNETTNNNYLACYSDTLHDFLNIYIQAKDSKQISVLRLGKDFKLKVHLKNIDVGRLNNIGLFGSNYLITKNIVYAIKSSTDTSGTQYYLNKYILKSESENFDYQLKWQYPFERKFIQNIQFLKSDSNFLFITATINKGSKAGTWCIKIDANEGKLLKVCKLEERNENAFYMPGNCTFNQNDKSLILFGQKLNGGQYNPLLQNYNLGSASVAIIYIIKFDSIGDISYRQDFKIPIKDIQQGNKKVNNGYLLKFNQPSQSKAGILTLGFDVFKNENQSACFYYTNTMLTHANFDGEKYQFTKFTISSNLEIDNYYRNKDKFNMNGRLCLDSSDYLHKIYNAKVSIPVKLAFKLDENENPYWLLIKTDSGKQIKVLSTLAPFNKIYQLKLVEQINSSINSKIIETSQKDFVIGKQIDENNFQMNLYHW